MECGDSSPLLHATTRRGELPPLTSQRLEKAGASSRTPKDSLPAVPKVRFESPEISHCGDSPPLLHATTRRGELPPLTSQRLEKAGASSRTPNSVPSTSAPAAYRYVETLALEASFQSGKREQAPALHTGVTLTQPCSHIQSRRRPRFL
jgi:hypothetical protein